MVSARVLKAINFVTLVHAGQVDKAGVPYIAHVIRVALAVEVLGEDTFIAALSHDVVEDTDTTLEDIRELFGEVVADMVDSVTRRSGETYEQSIDRCCLNQSAVPIKLADNDDNSRPERIAALPPEQRDIVKRYRKARVKLDAALARQVVAKYWAAVPGFEEYIRDIHSARNASPLPEGVGQPWPQPVPEIVEIPPPYPAKP